MIQPDCKILVVGPTGAVGSVLLGLLEERGYYKSAFAGRDSREIAVNGKVYQQTSLDEVDFSAYDIAIMCTPSSVSLEYAPRIAASGCLVVDNSSAFRMDSNVPLVVPEVNGDVLRTEVGTGIIANPNCSTIIMLLAIGPLEKAFGVRRVIVSTYQAVSGAGKAAMEELKAAARADLAGEQYEPKVFRQVPAFNVFSHDSAIDIESGYNGEELKMRAETQKILGREIGVAATCVRVPVVRSHCESVSVELDRPATLDEVRNVLQTADGLVVKDDRQDNLAPTALDATGSPDVLVGRIRPDSSLPPAGKRESGEDEYTGFAFFLAGDQLLKGAALNALQIASKLEAIQARVSVE